MCSKIIFLDPSSEEESLATGTITIVTKDEEHICMVHKPGMVRTLTKFQPLSTHYAYCTAAKIFILPLFFNSKLVRIILSKADILMYVGQS